MAEAPKIPQIVRERLLVQQAAPGGEHPDADTLTAFSEDTLTARERSLVTSHLSTCGSCREIMILSQPLAAEAAAVAAARTSRAPGWMAFRWAALAACLVLTVGVVLFERSSREPKFAPPETIATAPATAPPQTFQDEQPKAEAERAQSKPEARSENPALAAKTRTEKPAPLNQRAFGGQAGYASFQANSMGRGSDGGEKFGERSKASRSRRQTAPAREGEFYSSNAAAAPSAAFDRPNQFSTAPSPPPPTAASGGVVGGIVTGNTAGAQIAGRQSRPETLGKLSPGVVAANEAGEADQTSEAQLAKQEPGKKKVADETLPMTAASSRRPLPRDDKTAVAQSLAMSAPTSSSNFKLEAKDQAEVLTTNKEKLATASPTPVQWRIRGGKLQQSNDSGKTWKEVNIPTGASLRAFWSLGNNVWAGGTQGSLFYITDDGKNSVQIPIKMDDGNVSQTVVAITFSDEMNGIITLENGQILQTADGGKTWERH
jgi:hypothetical protein